MTTSKRKPPRRRPAANNAVSRAAAVKKRLEEAGLLVAADPGDPTCWRVSRPSDPKEAVWLVWPESDYWRRDDWSKTGYGLRRLIQVTRETSSPSS